MVVSLQPRRVYPSAVALLLFCATLAAGCGSRPDSPSVLLVVAQGVRADHMSALGYSRQTTPVLDSLAAEGILFSRAYTSSPRSSAAIASLLTGKAPQEHGVLYQPVLSDSIPDLPDWLEERGYQTLVVNSDPGLADIQGLLAGFDLSESVDPVTVPELDGGTAAVTERAIQWLADERDPARPFFLTLVYSGAALPFDPPEPFDTRFTEAWMGNEILDRASAVWTPLARRINSGELVLGQADLDVLVSLYDGELGYLDQKVGEVVAALREEGLLDSTLVIVTSDRGNDLGAGGHLSDATSLSEANLNVPLILRGPGVAGPGTVTDGLVQELDLFVTLCSLLGIEPPEGASSVAISQAPLDGSPRRATAVSMTLKPFGPGVVDLSFSIRDDRYRYDREPDGPSRLVDLQGEEPGPDILESSPEIARRLEAQLGAWNGMLDRLPGTGSQAVPDESMVAPGDGEGDRE